MAQLMEPGAEPIAGYRLTRYLGRGGFGEVWEAEAPGGLSKAIKLVPMDLTDDALESSELEGLQKIRALRHPYLLSIERFEILDGDLLIVMELADENLADRFGRYVQEGLPGIPRDELLTYMREASEVLDVMSQQHELQHLDIKPENLFLSGGHVKVADFGLVKPSKSSMARAAVAISPPYAPPELFDGKVEPTADQYSLAVTYQELLTGTRPYQANDMRRLIYMHLRGKPDLSAVQLADRPILSRAYQRDPEKRFGSCTEFVENLCRAVVFGTPVLEPQSADQPPLAETTETAAAQAAVEPALAEDVAAPRFVPPKTDRLTSDTQPLEQIAEETARIKAMEENPPIAEDGEQSLAFVAFLPLEIYAIKLRGFIDAMGAEIIDGDDERTVLRFASRSWLGFKSPKGIFLQLDTFRRDLQSDNRLVEATIWSTNEKVRGRELTRRFQLMIQLLKSFLMATDKSPRRVRSNAQIRQEILG